MSVPSPSSADTMLAWALRYIRLGWPVFPLAVRSKMPMIPVAQGGKGVLDATLDPEKAREWWTRWPNANIGIATGIRFFVFDKDIKDNGEENFEFLIRHHGRAGFEGTVQQVTGSGGVQYLFQLPGFPVRNSQGSQGGIARGIDIRGHHGYIVAPPSIHPDTGRAYFWDGGKEIEDEAIAPAPAWLVDWLRKHSQRKTEGPQAEPVSQKIAKGSRHNTLVSIAGSMRRRGLSAVEIFALLKVSNETRCDPPYDEEHLRKIAESMEQYPPDARSNVFRQAAPPPPAEPGDARDELALTAADVEAAIDAAIANNDLLAAVKLAPEIAKQRAVTQALILTKLRLHFKRDFPAREFDRAIRGALAEAGASDGSDGGDKPPDPPAGGEEDGDGPNLRFQPLTDAGNGERIALMFRGQIRYCIEMKNWLIWDGKRWSVDSAATIKQRAKEMARTLYLQAMGNTALEKHARDSESHKSIMAALNCAATERGIPISTSDLDQHPYLLNCPNGVVDLRDGTLLPHNADFLITKLCPVEYHAEAQCPRFQAFIEWAMGGNPEAELTERTVRLVGFLQRAFGYALTSDVTEKALFIFYGNKGNNGKTTLLTLFRHLLGKDYSAQISIETVMAAKSQDATMRADLADLRGSRFVVTSEVEKEHKLNEGKIKFITAGLSEIKACRKYENPIEFPASHKLFMDCNHRPSVRGTDDAIWSRLKLVPFEVRIEKDHLDKSLPDKLRAEFDGVLAWAVRGCMAWMKDGLGEPPEVSAAGEEWREHDDPLKEFLEDACVSEPDLFVKATDLSAAYELWCKQNREKYPVGRENFAERMLSKGYTHSRSRRIDGKQARTWEGIELKAEMRDALHRGAVTNRAFQTSDSD